MAGKKSMGFFPLLHYFSNSNALRLHRHYVRMQCLTLQWWKWPQSKFQTASAFVRDFLIGPKILRNYSFGTLNGRRRRTPRTALVFFKWPIFFLWKYFTVGRICFHEYWLFWIEEWRKTRSRHNMHHSLNYEFVRIWVLPLKL